MNRFATTTFAFLALVDVTDRLRADEALRASEEQHRVLMECAQDVIFVVNGRGIVVEANAAAERLLGAPESAIEGRVRRVDGRRRPGSRSTAFREHAATRQHRG